MYIYIYINRWLYCEAQPLWKDAKPCTMRDKRRAQPSAGAVNRRVFSTTATPVAPWGFPMGKYVHFTQTTEENT